MTEALEFQDVSSEFRGTMCPGRLKLTDQNIVFKNKKTGKVEQINGPDLEFVNWQKLVGTWALRIFLKNGSLHRYAGFKESEIEKIGSFFKNNYKIEMPEKELSVRGWNWGAAKFVGNVVSFDVNNTTAFEIPLKDVSQCVTGKNEITMEFHPNDEAAESLIEMRFYIPTSEMAGDTDPVEAFKDNVMKEASVINVSGDAIAVFNEVQCLTPRGRYDIKVFHSFFQLHGKTFDYKIPISTVLRLFTLPHKDGRQNFFVISLDPPIKQGQTRYHFLTLLFNQDELSEIELPFTEDELKEKYEGKLEKKLNGPTFEVMAKIMKVIVNRKITVPGSFKGATGTPAVSCSYKAAAGSIYPLERGFIFIHKPPMHIRFEEIATVEFARGGGSTRSFDFEIELKSGVIHTFNSIEKEEYNKLFDFISNKKLRVKNTGKSDKPIYKEDFGSSDDEKEPDAYLARVKREAEERDDDDEEDESTDEDFNPDQVESDVAEEYDSNPTPTDSSVDSDASEGTKKKKEKSKSKKTITISERPRKPKKEKDSSGSSKKKKKDKNAPKKPMTAFMMWMNDNREKIKKDNPGISFTDIAKKAGELWKSLSSKDKAEYDEKVNNAKEEYAKAMKAYQESGGGADADSDEDKKPSKSKKSTSSTKKKTSAAIGVSPHKVISKEYVDTDDSSDSDNDKKSSKRKKGDSDSESKAKKKVKEETKSSDDDVDDSEKEKSKESSKGKSKTTIKKEKKSSGEESDSDDSEKEKSKKSSKGSGKKSAKKDESDSAEEKPKSKSGKGKPTTEKDISDEEYDEPVESTPPSSDADSASGGGSDDDEDDD